MDVNRNMISSCLIKLYWDSSKNEYFKLSKLPPNLKWKGLLRLEHRTMGDEDRILLFASGRAGIIGKIIFTSAIIKSSSPYSKDENTHIRVIDRELSSYTMEELLSMVQAKIVNLEMKEDYRGLDLGSLLFYLAMTTLRLRYQENIRCSLDAKEDVRRHNRLLTFYRNLGCDIKPNGKVSYVGDSNGDQVIRKIPMHIVLHPVIIEGNKHNTISNRPSVHEMIAEGYQFTPIVFLAQPHYSLHPIHVQILDRSKPQSSRPIQMLLIERQEGLLQIQTTLGMILIIDNDGILHLRSYELKKPDDDSYFVINRWYENTEKCEDSIWDDLWTIQSVSRKLFLSTACFDYSSRSYHRQETSLRSSKVPVFWSIQGHPKHNGITFTCTKETPMHRFHRRQYWSIQSLQYAIDRKASLEQYSMKRRMTIHEALDLTRNIPLKPFRKHRASASNTGISVRTMCFAMAEAARMENLPDWIQVISLIHELGRVASLFDHGIQVGFDWTISCATRVLGIRPPNICSFATFRHLDPDSERYNDIKSMYTRQCGLRNTHFAWTGPEYLYHILKLNHTLLCDEALTVLRLFLLRCWHKCKGEYIDIEDNDDVFIKSTVNEFDRLRRRVKRYLYENEDITKNHFSDATCESLWNEYYEALLAKYNCDGVMQW